VTGRWFSPDTQVSSTNETNRHDITEILLTVALNTVTLTLNLSCCIYIVCLSKCDRTEVEFASLSPLKLQVQFPNLARCTRYSCNIVYLGRVDLLGIWTLSAFVDAAVSGAAY
jgi:hypothetical protein